MEVMRGQSENKCRWFFRIGCISMILFCLLAFLVQTQNWLVLWDKQITLDLHDFALAHPQWARGFYYLTILANFWPIVFVNLGGIGLALLWRKGTLAISWSLVVMGGLILYEGLKVLISRDRPEIDLRDANIVVMTKSFPSGHAVMATVTYGILCYFLLGRARSRFVRGLVATLGVLLILLIGLSRIYLRVHYLTDVVAGFCLGTALLMAFLYGLELTKETIAEVGVDRIIKPPPD